MFNVDRTANKADQILEAVDIILQYKMHSEQMLLAVSSLGKQDLILGYSQLKEHSLEVNWEKEEVNMIYCSPRYNGCRNIQKTRRVEEWTILAYWSRLFPQILEENEKLDMTIDSKKLGGEPGDKVFLIYIFSEKFFADI